ncbi:MAG: hypothetical protein KDD41_09715 [Flavobacteriales bacterium]|nr:hypothetical protein [Flavobacteriales bacterium]
MLDFRLRPKAGYIHNAEWEELYVLTEHWKSDMDFYHDEVRFLNKLIAKYFMWLSDGKNIIVVKSLQDELNVLANNKDGLRLLCLKHLRHMEEYVENPFSHDETEFKQEHQLLEDRTARFVKDFKALKRDIFSVTEKVIEDEHLNHLITNN